MGHDEIKKSLDCFKNFRSIGALQKAVLQYIVMNLFEERDLDHYRKIFYAINKKADGMLTRQEFLHAFWEVGYK